jgi:hypothetical protein
MYINTPAGSENVPGADILNIFSPLKVIFLGIS